MTDPPEPTLPDPAHERLTNPDEALRGHYRWRADRPPAEFSRPTRILIYTAAALGLVLALIVIGYVIAHVWRIP